MMTPSSSDDRNWSLRRGPEFSWAKTKKPAAGGGAAGFRKKPNDSWEEECCHSTDDPGRRMGRLYIEGMREEVHRFDRNNHTYFLLS
ncbi:hypothetical protein GFL92_07175 [Rhizobium leguminosarum bv. viciae]|nr:hypothetical protein [Rhizobium leguminosarum bv. viciae]